MNGTSLLNEIKRRIMQRRETKSVSDSVLANELGVSVAGLVLWRDKELTARQVVNIMEKFAKTTEARLIDATIKPVVEFLQIDYVESKQGARWEMFSSVDVEGKRHPYFAGLRERLEGSHGIYIFHDSRGRAIYAGKAQRLSLWAEMNNAFNRDRGEVQNIKRVSHPSKKVEYRGLEEKKRQIGKQSVALHEIASYASAYQVPDRLIGKFEALIVRAFANDLLNVRMENI